MTIEEAIQKACNEGYFLKLKNKITQYEIDLPTARETLIYQELRKEFIYKSVVLDPLFWQALGKAMGWKESVCPRCGNEVTTNSQLICWDCEINVPLNPEWVSNWHRMIDHLAEGGTIESYFHEIH